MNDLINVVPDGWVLNTLGGICEKPQYGWTTKANKDSGQIKLLRTTDITSGSLNWKTVPFCTEAPDNIEKYLLHDGDIVISRAGSVGVSFLLSKVEKAVFASYLIRFRVKDQIDRKYVYYFLQSPSYWEAICSSKSGIAVPNVNATKLAKVPIPLAPLEQQKRIVAEIEKQFSRLDEAVANLKRVKANLKRYKAAVLKAAVEGKLTEEWRKLHPDVEPADKLLERILEERRANWQGRGKYKEPVGVDTGGLPELPDGWVWTQYEQVGRMQLGRQRSPKYHTGLNMRPYLRVANVFEDRIDLSDVKEMDFPPSDFEKYELTPGDLLLNEGQSPEFLGRPAVYRGELPGACFTNTLIRFRAIEGVRVEFALIVSRHNMHAGRFVDEGTITTNIAHLSLGRLSTVEFPLPPEEEQGRIVDEVERQLSIVAEAETQVDTNLRRADRLRQSILRQAFSGALS